jgi:iron(III) transport system substrate-binding protein
MISRLLTCWLVLILGCARETRTPIVVYSPHGTEMLAEFEAAYEAAHPDQDVRWIDMGSQDIYDRVRTERANPQADVWWGGPSVLLARAERESLLAPYEPSWASALPPSRKSIHGFWHGTFLTPEVIMYNTRAVPDSIAPADWDDLLHPRWRGKIIIRHPLASGTMRTIFCSLILREQRRSGSLEDGFRWLARLDANTRTYAADPTQLYLKIAREEGLVTLWNLPDVIIQVRRNGYPFGYRLPSSGTPLITDGIALVRGSRHPEEARSFYEFVTSRASLLRQAEAFGRIPARTDIPQADLPGWIGGLTILPMEVDWDAVAAHEREWMGIWDQRVKGSGRKGE